jgi:hypothetical protein
MTVPGLQRITTQSSVRRLRKLIFVLRCARDTNQEFGACMIRNGRVNSRDVSDHMKT